MEENYIQESLFDLNRESEKAKVNNRLDVVKMDYISAESMTWEELFDGFDELYAITFSSGINFVYELSKRFSKMEVVFGCEDVMSFSLQEIMAYQGKLIDRLRNESKKRNLDIIDRINDGSIHFYVANKQISHEKLYLLKANDGRKRVVTGSANMSYNAFGGRQRENIVYLDSERAFDWYYYVFLLLRDDSTDEISKKAYELSDISDNLDLLPISERIKRDRVFTIESQKNADEDIEFILDVKRISEELKPLIPKNENKKKSRRTIIQADDIIKIKRKVIEDNARQKDLRSEFPQLVLDIENSRAVLNGEVLDLSPTDKDISKDVELFIRYMEGYKDFHGDFEGMQLRYFEFANWVFCSPFMAYMRDLAARYDQNRLPYPVFGLLYGKSKAGKTSFLETLEKMMIGQKPKIAAPDFTRKTIEGLKNIVKGAPIIVDDLTNTRFNQHAIETIKNDDFGVVDHNTSYPAVIISANEDVKAVAPEIIRRTVICRVEAGLTNTEVMKSSIVRYVQHNIGTAFYREYLRRMLDRIPEMAEVIKDDDIVSAPDILQTSSEVLVDIVSEHSSDVPSYIRCLNLENYFSEQVTGKYAIKMIKNAWRTSQSAFSINRSNNELRYNAGNTFEADRIIKELPENLEAHKARDVIIMNLREAEEFLEIEFRIPWYKRIFK